MTKQLTRNSLLVSISMLLLMPCAVFSQEPAPKPKKTTHLRIEVTVGEEEEPVSGADVFVRSQDEGAPFERTLRTREGLVSFTRVPTVKVLIQVTVAGCKTFGRKYELAQDDDQTITIRLEKNQDGGH